MDLRDVWRRHGRTGRGRVVVGGTVVLLLGLGGVAHSQLNTGPHGHPVARSVLAARPAHPPVKHPLAAARARQFAQLTGGLKASQVKVEDQCGRPRPEVTTCISQKLVLRKNGKPVHPPVHPSATFTQVFPTDQQGIAPTASATGAAQPSPGTPAWLQQAYDLGYISQTGGVGKTVAIVDAYDDPSAESDLATYRATYGLPSCTTANGCFKKVNGLGNASPLPAADPDWDGEISLDLDAVSALCPNCHILLLEASYAGSNALSQAVQTAATWPGVVAVSNSYGSEQSAPDGYPWTHAGIPTVYGSGDWGTPPAGYLFYPAALPGVTAAGGTNLLSSGSQTGNYSAPTQVTPTARGFAESAWAWNGSTGAGDGCNTQPGIAKPSYQKDTGCAGRSIADLSADADPMTGVRVYSSVDGGWVIYGGTSLATPLISAYIAATGVNNGDSSPAWAYTNASGLYDPQGGSTANGACPYASYICTAGPGYDGPTGAGSISGALVTGGPGIEGPPMGWGGWNNTNDYLKTIGATTATLNGGITPNGLDTTYYWQYGPTTSYGSQSPSADVGPGTAATMVTTTLTGLAPGTTYHYRLVASNTAGTSYGYDFTLTTLAAPPSNTTPPAITGTPREGQSLLASTGTWSGNVLSLAWQWQRSADGSTWTNISGAVGASYTPVAADIGSSLRATVTASSSSGSSSATSSPVGPILSGAPANTVSPAISGAPKQGQLLTASSTWNPSGTLTYQWQRSADGATWTNISGATAISYTAQKADEGTSLHVTVTAANSFGQASATSQAVGPVAADPPLNTVAPVMSGTTQRTSTLQATQGTWSGGGNVYSYQWQRSNDNVTWTSIAGATASSYTLGQGDEGTIMRVLISASNPDGVVSVASNVAPTIVSAYPPANTAPPTISGTATRTATLAAALGTWTGPNLSFAYQWQRDAGNGYVNIPGASGSTYTLQASDEGTVVRVVVAAANIDGTIIEASQPSAVVQNAGPISLNRPTVAGSALRGQILTGSQGTWGGLGNSYAFQWQSSTDGQTWTSIPNATTLTYTLGQGDEGAQLRLQVTASNPDGTAVAQSDPTAIVPNSAPTNSVPPTVAGTAQRGSILTGTQGTWAGIGNAYSDQWQHSPDGITWTNIAGATGTSYTLTPADVNQSVRLRVTATNVDGTLAVVSQPTATVLAVPPVNTARPTISGAARRDSTLTAAQGTWSGLGNTYAFQWQHSSDGGSTWSNITGATGATYVLTKADEGSALRMLLTATDPDGSATATSTASATVQAAPPVLTAAPAITGTAQRGSTLSAGQGTWSGIGNSYAYQWQHSSDGGSTWSNIDGATSQSYALALADEATLIRVQVTVSNVDATASATTSAIGPVQGAAPANTGAPAVTGTAQRGQTLTGTQGTWSGLDNTYAYQWQRSAGAGTWTSISGATGPSYVLGVADEGSQVRLRVTATNPDAAGGVAAASNATATVPSSPPVSTAVPTISGSAQRASVLTGTQGTWTGIANTYVLQWQRSADGGTWTNISGATGSSYTLGVADENTEVRLLVTATNPDAPSGVSAASTPTGTIPSSPPASTSAPVLTGTAQRGQTVTATQGAWTGIGNTYTTQWQRNSGSGYTNIAGATGATYVIGVADENATIRMLVTATNPDGTQAVPSNATTSVPAAPPVNSAAPTITGTAQRTFTLIGTQGTWTGIANTYVLQWQRSSDGQNWSAITGATSSTYTLGAADEGNYVRLQATATNVDGTLSVASLSTGKVLGAPPVNSAAPTITGTAQRTVILTGTQGTWTGIGNTYAYQWQRSTDGATWSDILGATALSYKLTVADEGSSVRLKVTASNADATTSATSTGSPSVASAPPIANTAPSISGTTQRTGVLTLGSTGTWTGPDNAYTYQWQRSADGTTWTTITGASNQSYTLTAADEGDRVRAVVIATNPDAPSGVRANSNASATVQALPPINTVLPTVSGAAQRGSTLTAGQGTWSGAGNAYAYRWQSSADGRTWTDIAAQTTASYTLGVTDEHTYVRVLVTATNPDALVGVSAASVATSAVQAVPPQNTAPPSISGTARLGVALNADPGTWTPAGATFAYQWQRSTDSGQTWANITGASAKSYTLATADVSNIVRVVVTATNVDGSKTATSATTTMVLQPPQNLSPPSTPTGTLHDTYTLSADRGTWDGNPTGYTYTWLRCGATTTSVDSSCTAVGSNSATYSLGSADIGHTIAVSVQASSAGGTSPASTSVPTVVVTGRPLTNTAAPSIIGTPQIPNTLQAAAGTWSVPTTSIAYAWQRCDADGASNCAQVSTSTQYTLSGADGGHTLVLYVTATSPGQTTTAHSTAITVTAQPLPQATVAPTVSGTAQRTFTLSSTPGTWTNAPTLRSQWRRCDTSGQNCTDIAGATGPYYTLSQADEGDEITIAVTATNSSGSTVATAQPTNAVAAFAPSILRSPSLTGSAYTQDVQIGIVSDWSFQTTADTTYATAWERCDTSGQNCQTIAGATSNLYTPTSADVGQTLVGVITATNMDGSVPASSKPTPVISTAGPRWKTLPLISSDLGRVGDELTITPGSFTGPKLDTDVVQLMRCTNTCVAAGQAGQSSYTIANVDLGALMRVQETAANAGGSVSIWSARYVGPVISAAAGSAVLNPTGAIKVRNTNGETLATAQVQAQMIAAVARATAKRPTTRVLKLKRAPGIHGKLQAWVCPVPVGSAPPGTCTAKVALRSAATVRIPPAMSGQLRVVVVRRGH